MWVYISRYCFPANINHPLNINLMKTSILSAAAAIALFVLPACGSCEQSKECATDSTDAVIQNIMTRTSIRKFTNQPIPADTLEQLVKCGMAAPTAVNAQPWAFVVVTEREVLDSLNANHPWARLETATAAIVVCGDMNKALEGPAREYWVQDCSAATENILLAAHAYGLGAVWCGVYHGPESERVAPIAKVLNLPDDIIPLDIITLGFPDENPTPKDKWKPEQVHYQTW